MPATGVERTRKYIEKFKLSGQYDALKKRKAENEKLRRQRLRESLTKLTENKRKQLVFNARSKTRERVRKFREKHKKVQLQQADIETNLETNIQADIQLCNVSPPQNSHLKHVHFQNSYKTDAALAKAVTKARKEIPSSPSKRNAVIAKLLYSLDEKSKAEIISNKTKINKGGNKGIGSTLTEEIYQFYERDDISRMSPNAKDSRFYRNPKTGDKEIRQKRHLVVTLQQAYDKFITENAGKYQHQTSVKLAKFCALRPKHVLLVNSIPLNVCVCLYHANFIKCCTVLHKHLPMFPAYGLQLKRLLVCNEESKDCCFKTCKDCQPKKIEKKLRAMIKPNQKKMVQWWQWEKDETVNRTEKKPKTGTLKDLMDTFINIYQAYLKHSFTTNQQYISFKEDREHVDSNRNECLLQIDFAENFTNEAQDEAVNAHWNQKQMSLFTASLRYWKKTHPKGIVSDNLDHSKDTIVAYMYTILSKVPKEVKVVRLWSDGPNNQFKNKYMAATIKLLEAKFRKKIIWNYFTTAHGKGNIDGIGAAAKKVKRLMKQRKATVNCAKDFLMAFNQEKSSVELVEMSSTDIAKINTSLKLNNVINEARNVKDIFQFHQLQCVNNNIKGFLFSKDGYASLKL